MNYSLKFCIGGRIMDNFREKAKIVFQYILERYNENNIIDTEADFCKEFGISRTMNREIMAVAKLIGAVTPRRGSCQRLTNKKELQDFFDRYLKD